MALSKEIKIASIKVSGGQWKILQITGKTVVTDEDEIIAENPYNFALCPNQTPSEMVAYQELPSSEKAKVDELVDALWTDQLKAAYQEDQVASHNAPTL